MSTDAIVQQPLSPSLPPQRRSPPSHEDWAIENFLLRGFDWADLRIEKLAGPRQLYVLRIAGARMSGPDFVVTRITDHARWAVDAKTSTRAPQPPGENRYSISTDAVLAMEAYAWQHNIPGCFVLGDGYVITPDEVRDAGKRGLRYGADGRAYFVIYSRAGRPFDVIFGRPDDYDMIPAVAA